MPSDGDALPPTRSQVAKRKLDSRSLPGGWALEMLSFLLPALRRSITCGMARVTQKNKSSPHPERTCVGQRFVRFVCSLV